MPHSDPLHVTAGTTAPDAHEEQAEDVIAWLDAASLARGYRDGSFTPIRAVQHGVQVPNLINVVALIHEIEDGARPRDMAALQAVSGGLSQDIGNTDNESLLKATAVESIAEEDDVTSR